MAYRLTPFPFPSVSPAGLLTFGFDSCEFVMDSRVMGRLTVLAEHEMLTMDATQTQS